MQKRTHGCPFCSALFIKGNWAVPPLATDKKQNKKNFRLTRRNGKKKRFQKTLIQTGWRSLHLQRVASQRLGRHIFIVRGTQQTLHFVWIFFKKICMWMDSGMLLVLLCFMTLVALMVVIKACCQSEMFGKREESPDSSSDSVVQVSVVESTVSAISIPDVVFERSCRMNGNVNDDFIDIDFSLPPSYEEAVKMPLPFRSSS
ncbi:hypothetical protein GHT06_017472 [Daphnia sinensis]|uniref:Transmembrane protein n=1 Tax=Daphnia sinensis TaxID=1820382 RepID=A0AAD5KPX8_9CRUS|nr:hypothetical protein GHT06_017472 [Daphnia sinensis]